MTPDTNPESTAEFDAMLRMGVRETLTTNDFDTAFERFLAELPRQSPGFAGQIPPGAERAIGFTLFREIWNHTPRPESDWKHLTLPKPERNAPCPCGSGRKYKQCCGPMEGSSPFPTEGFSVLAYVIETIPVDRYDTLPFKQLDPEEVAHVAAEWRKDGRIEPAARLLEALLAPGAKLDARHEFAFDTLCDLYLDTWQEEARLALVERLMQMPDRLLRAAAWQRRATMHADRSEHDRAWEVFQEAQRLDPDNPSLSHLELVLLANQGRFEEARKRADFWAKRLTRLGYGGESIVDLMAAVAADPYVLREMMAAHEAGFDEDPDEVTQENLATLDRLIGNLPAPSCHYGLTPQGETAGPLQPAAELAAGEREWARLFGEGAEDSEPWTETAWLDWLQANPLAWQSFSVIEDVLGLFHDSLFPEEAEGRIDVLEEILLAHAQAVLRRVLAENKAEGLRLDWGWQENRPALRLLMGLIGLEYRSEAELPLLEWLLALNPTDNGGHRERLVHAYCEAGRAEDALAVCDRYPDDSLPGILYGRVLALYLLDRRGEAVAALAQAIERLPKVHKTLIAARPKPPKQIADPVSHGGDEEAWLYCLDYRDSWEMCAALDWLKSVSGRKG